MKAMARPVLLLAVMVMVMTAVCGEQGVVVEEDGSLFEEVPHPIKRESNVTPSEEIASLQSKIRFLEEEIERLRGEFNGHLVHRDSRIGELEEALKSRHEEVEAVRGEYAQVRRIAEELEGENHGLRANLEEKEREVAQLHSTGGEEVGQLERAVKELKEEMVALKAELKVKEDAIAQVPRIVRAEREAVEKRATEEREKLERRAYELEGKLDTLVQEKAKGQWDHGEIKMKVGQLKEERDVLYKEKIELLQERDALYREKIELQEQVRVHHES